MTNQRFIVLAFFAIGVLVGITVRGLGLPLLASFEVADPQLFGVVNGSSIVALLVGGATFFTLLRQQPAYTFADEAISELRKTTWPGKEETVRSTGVVIGTTFVLATTMATYDLVWAKLTSFFLFTQG